MPTLLSAAQKNVFDQIDETTFWAIAYAYRIERQREQNEAAAFEEASAVLGDRFPTVSGGTIDVVARAVLARAAPAPLDWFWE
ncbi:MAG: hypothetical protein ACR2QH_04925 [Geminicoccaceae bacterium]